MTIKPEHVTRLTNKQGEIYYSFTLMFLFEGRGFLNSLGWRYYPSTGMLGSPQRDLGRGRYLTTAWLGGELYEEVQQQVQEYFIDSLKLCPAPWESPEDRKKAASEGMSEQEYDRLRMIAYQQGARTTEAVEAWIKKHLRKKGKRR